MTAKTNYYLNQCRFMYGYPWGADTTQHKYFTSMTMNPGAPSQFASGGTTISTRAVQDVAFEEFLNKYRKGGKFNYQVPYIAKITVTEDGVLYKEVTGASLTEKSKEPPVPIVYPPIIPTPWEYNILTSSDFGQHRNVAYSSGAKFENRDLALADAYSRISSYKDVFRIAVSKDHLNYEQIDVMDTKTWIYGISIYDIGNNKELYKSPLQFNDIAQAKAQLDLIRSQYDDGSKPLHAGIFDKDREVWSVIWSPGVIHEVPPIPPIPEPSPEPSQCFIATAAFGTPLEPEVNSLRAFRDMKLIPNIAGRGLVKTYYTISPPIANGIRKSEPLKAFTRNILEPFIKAFGR